MDKKPVIGLVTNKIPDPLHPDWSFFANRSQDVEAVVNAGGIPFLLPPVMVSRQIEDILERLDGLYLAGGGDLDGTFYGSRGNPLIKAVNRPRDEFELGLVQLVRKLHIPTLGICRGCQVMNVAAGGGLVVDIPTSIPGSLVHEPEENQSFVSHPVTLNPNSRLAAIYQATSLTVNSYHHQSVLFPGKGLISTASTVDGVIEAVEDDMHPFFIGVQWHPERTEGNQSGIEKIFLEFILSARNKINSGYN